YEKIWTVDRKYNTQTGAFGDCHHPVDEEGSWYQQHRHQAGLCQMSHSEETCNLVKTNKIIFWEPNSYNMNP
ncbi:Hypothetical protein FKW44_009743, partial [Caligus rogercresseyi]